jgi:hypothetical protein
MPKIYANRLGRRYIEQEVIVEVGNAKDGIERQVAAIKIEQRAESHHVRQVARGAGEWRFHFSI